MFNDGELRIRKVCTGALVSACVPGVRAAHAKRQRTTGDFEGIARVSIADGAIGGE